MSLFHSEDMFGPQFYIHDDRCTQLCSNNKDTTQAVLNLAPPINGFIRLIDLLKIIIQLLQTINTVMV